jgi:demethylspheroidene O-methyltransferase
MADLTAPPSGRGLVARLAGSRAFQAWAARMPGLSWLVQREGQALFDMMQGFVRSQVLTALVELDVLSELASGPRTAAAMAVPRGLTPERMAALLQAGAGIALLRRRRDGTFALSRRGAAFLAVPGLPAMVRHHAVLYRDLADPVALLRGETAPELARFWPYVFGAAAAEDPSTAATYSRLMSDSQALVAEDTLDLVPLRGVRHLMDVGGGTGSFLRAVAARHPDLRLTLFDLPAVVAQAPVGGRLSVVPGSFRDDVLPQGADAISLVRVLYDHSDATVAALLARVHAALPPGGMLLVSEPMGGGAAPDPGTDVYFAFYCMAMRTGRVRSAAEIAALLGQAGFAQVSAPRSRRPFVTSVLTARR